MFPHDRLAQIVEHPVIDAIASAFQRMQQAAAPHDRIERIEGNLMFRQIFQHQLFANIVLINNMRIPIQLLLRMREFLFKQPLMTVIDGDFRRCRSWIDHKNSIHRLKSEESCQIPARCLTTLSDRVQLLQRILSTPHIPRRGESKALFF